MGLISHLSYAYGAFSSSCVSFSSTMSLMIMVLGLGHLVRAIFHFPLEIVGRVSSSKSVGRVIGILQVGRISELIRIGELIRLSRLI